MLVINRAKPTPPLGEQLLEEPVPPVPRGGRVVTTQGEAISGSPTASRAVLVGMMAPGLDLGSWEGLGVTRKGQLLSALSVRSNTTLLLHPQVG